MMVCLLDAHRERSQELRYEIPSTTIPTTTYLDTFGNTVRRLIAPPGDLTITSDAVIEDSGLPALLTSKTHERDKATGRRSRGWTNHRRGLSSLTREVYATLRWARPA